MESWTTPSSQRRPERRCESASLSSVTVKRTTPPDARGTMLATLPRISARPILTFTAAPIPNLSASASGISPSMRNLDKSEITAIFSPWLTVDPILVFRYVTVPRRGAVTRALSRVRRIWARFLSRMERSRLRPSALARCVLRRLSS